MWAPRSAKPKIIDPSTSNSISERIGCGKQRPLKAGPCEVTTFVTSSVHGIQYSQEVLCTGPLLKSKGNAGTATDQVEVASSNAYTMAFKSVIVPPDEASQITPK